MNTDPDVDDDRIDPVARDRGPICAPRGKRWRAARIGADYEGDLRPGSDGDGRVVRKPIREDGHD